MSWSTRELAELIGVTLRSVRHWHEVGLMPEPARRSNGYKQYDTSHLVLGLRIARLSGLGFDLAEIARMLDGDGDTAPLQALRQALSGRISELERLRAEVDALIASQSAPDLSPGAQEVLEAFEEVGAHAGARDIAILLSRMVPADGLRDFSEALRRDASGLAAIEAEVQALPADASPEHIEDLIERATATIRTFEATQASSEVEGRAPAAQAELARAIADLATGDLHPAQRRVMQGITRRLGEGEPAD